MTYESDNPQFDHLINNMDSDEVPRKTRRQDGVFCRHCGEGLVAKQDYWTHANGLYRCQGGNGVSYGHNAAHPDVPCEFGLPNPCKCTYAPDTL